MSKNHEINICRVPEQSTQESLEGLSSPEVRNLNSEVQQSAPNGAAKLTCLIEGVATETSRAVSIAESNVIAQTSGDAQKCWEHRANPAVRNADNKMLGAINNGRFIIGHVEEVNGAGAEEVQGFLPTRNELIQLAKYWAKVGIDIDYYWFCFSTDRQY